MNEREIKLAAKHALNQYGGSIVAINLFSVMVILFFVMCEILIYTLLKSAGWGWLYTIESFKSNTYAKLFWGGKLIIMLMLLLPKTAALRRLFIDAVIKGDIMDSRNFIFAHYTSSYVTPLKYSLLYNLLKLFALTPAVVSASGVYYWVWVCRLHDLNSIDLFAFMLCLGLTIVFFCVFVHYCISLALTPYIMALNPRSNVFDACDLSVKLMDGQHIRYITFLFSFIKYVPLLVFIYPVFVIVPYFKVCYLMMMKDILGDYWQDKMPGMVKRWKKYLD